MNEYRIGGKIFLKVGGKFVPKFQGGANMTDLSNQFGILKNNYQTAVPIDDAQRTWSADDARKYMGASEGSTQPAKEKESVSTYGTYLDAGATMLNSLARKPQPGTSGRGTAISKSYGDNTINNIGAGIVGTAAMLDPTGTSKLIDSAMKIGRAAKNVINPGDEYGVSRSNVAEIAGNVLDPIGRMQQTFTIGKKHGFGNAVLDSLTFGVHGNNLMKKDVKEGLARDKYDDMTMRQGMNQGSYRNDSVYAQEGRELRSMKATNQQPNVEIEDGEIVLANPKNIKIHGGGNTSLESKYAAMFHGDKHGEDKDKDGMEGIPLTADGGYVASDYLGVNGKRAGKGNPSVAQEMKPYVKYLHNAEKNESDVYRNNPVAIAEINRQLEIIKNKAEEGKVLEGLSKVLKDKNRSVDAVMQYVAENINNQSTQQPQTEMYQTPISRFGGRYMQQGGMAQPEQNMSAESFDQLIQQTPTMENQGQAPAGQPGAAPEGAALSAEAQQILAQLPPDIQQQIMQMPPEQQEGAIMEYAQQLGIAPQQAGVNGAPESQGASAGAAPAPEMGMEQGQPMMRFGGQIYRKGSPIKYRNGGNIVTGIIEDINVTNKTFRVR